MTEQTTREMLEEQFALKEEAQDTGTTEQTATETQETEQATEQLSLDEYLTAPGTYNPDIAQTFSTLPKEWRQYLTNREKEVETSTSSLNTEVEQTKWAKEFVEKHKDVFNGSNPADYLQGIMSVAMSMDKNPRETVLNLAKSVGIDLEHLPQGDPNPFEEKLSGLEDRLKSYDSYFEQMNAQKAMNEFNEFANAKDDAGNPVNKFFNDPAVRSEIATLIKSGLPLAQAYEKAIWSIPSIRDEMFKERMDADIAKKAQEAEKAKKAAFTPKGKEEPEQTGKTKTTRQMLEEAFANY